METIIKTKSLFYIILLLQIISTATCFSQEKLTYGIKGGIGFWRLVSLENSPASITPKYPIYSYPLGFSAGLFIENKLSEDFSIVSEILYENNRAKITIDTGIEGILDQAVTMQFINLPILLKYKAPWLYDTYCLLGPSFSYLLKANYGYADKIYIDYSGDVEITKNSPDLSTSIVLGFGGEVKISSINFLLELRAQLGITQFCYKDTTEYYHIGKWRNSGLLFLIGLHL